MALKTLNLVHIYPREMNIYGDSGNLKVLVRRLEQRNIKVKVSGVSAGQAMPKDADIIIGGGGQDSGQQVIEKDLKKKKAELKKMAEDGVAMLMVCGMYQLFGHYFSTKDGVKIPGIGIIDATTKASDRRMIGNLVVQSPFGRLVGFENHSGQTELAEDQLPLGKVIKGFGNNGSDGREGAVHKNVFGTYMHGPILPKNPKLADEIIRRALDRKFGKGTLALQPLDDWIAEKAADLAAKRP